MTYPGWYTSPSRHCDSLSVQTAFLRLSSTRMITPGPSTAGSIAVEPVGEEVDLIAWAASLARRDGGGLRFRAFESALTRLGLSLNVIGVGPEVGATLVSGSRVGEVKRQFLPVPLRSRVERELPVAVSHSCCVSLLSASHRWSIRHHSWVWIDFPDLWSEYAANPTAEKGAVARWVSRRQGAVWARREREEASAADVVTTASWRDARALKGTWLPTPVWSRSSDVRSRDPSDGGRRVAGMLANFDYPPNRTALKRLQEVWADPLRAVGYDLVIAGFGSEGLGSETVRSLGPVDAVDDFYAQVDLVLAPVESGGGMKVKVIEALSRGLPVLADGHAVDGLPPSFAKAINLWEDGVAGVRLDDPRRFLGDDLDAFSVESFNERVAALWRPPAAKR